MPLIIISEANQVLQHKNPIKKQRPVYILFYVIWETFRFCKFIIQL